MTESQLCLDCLRPLATTEDEGIHNTGACGCASSRTLCWRTWNNDVCCPQSPYAPPTKTNVQMNTNITDEEVEKLKNSQTMVEWDAICDEIKKARGGQFPTDWWAKVKQSGIIDEATARFGEGQLTITAL